MSSLKFGPIFWPKLGEEQKQKELLSNLVRLFAQNQVKSKKRSSLKFGLIFCPKLGAGLNAPLGAVPKLNGET